jgi:hypothetical protein
MSNLFNLFQKIEKNPGMYIGRPSVSDLFMFVVGYEFARGESDLDLTDSEESFHADFQPWLQQRLGINSVASWAKLIMLTCHSEQEGFKQFFELLNEFQHQNIDRLQTGDLNEIYTQHNELEFQHR